MGLVERVMPLAIEGDDRVRAIRLGPTRLEDRPGRGRVAIRIPGDEALLDADQVIVALGQEPYGKASPGLDLVDPVSGRTSRTNVFMAGDRALGSGTVVDAIGHGARVARAVDTFLQGRARIHRRLVEFPSTFDVRPPAREAVDRAEPTEQPVAQRLARPDVEVETGLDPAASAAEAMRCYLCDLVFRVDESRCVFCDQCVDACPVRCIHYTRGGRPEDATRVPFWKRLGPRGKRGIVIDPAPCTRCGACAYVCPVSCIAVTRIDVVETVDP